MKNFTYKQTFIIGIVVAVIGYIVGNSSYLGSLLIVAGWVFIIASVVMLIKARNKTKKETKPDK